jgi:hypothetical protein
MFSKTGRKPTELQIRNLEQSVIAIEKEVCFMSDFIIKIIPSDPYYRVTEQKAQETIAYLKPRVKADKIEMAIYEMPVFVDCGVNLEKIVCPSCGTMLDFGWWGESMDAASENSFKNLSIELPCCGEESTLNDLQYHFPCGFSCVAFDILNPLDEPNNEYLTHIRELLGTPIRIIHAHL